MADSVVSFLLGHISQLLQHEANLLFGVEDKIKSLQNELEIINAYLKTSSKGNKNNNKEIEKIVLSQIRDVAHVAEDVIDTFIANVAIYKRRNVLGRMFHSVDHAKLLHDVAENIDKIKTKLKDIHENNIKYNQESSNQSTSATEEEERKRSLQRLRRNVEEENVVGFVHESEVVISRLIDGDSPHLNVVSIIGMGGLGKTTLARKVYNSDKVKKHFNCHAWVSVSIECRTRELLLGLLQNLMPEHDYESRSGNKIKKKGKKKHNEAVSNSQGFSSLSDDELKKRVWEFLKLKKYMLVLDDLWKIQDWEEVKDAFPDGNIGSRILITSRLKEVASHTGRDPPYYLQYLNKEQSWELFYKKVFRGEEYPCDLESLGKEIVKSCGGLPLSIVVLAGLLANKEKSHREWSKVLGHVNWYLTQDKETNVRDVVLQLSLDDLPSRLKPCFLYLGIFPEDSEIHVRRLLQLWVAEGFIQETGSRDAYDIAEDYLYELIDRSLIQVARVEDIEGVQTCRIHDLLRDLCILESKEDKIFEVCTETNILMPSKPRRLSVHSTMSQYISSSTKDHSCVRSLFFSNPDYFVASNKWKLLTKDVKLVRVLDFECGLKIPSNLGNFIHLRYLRIGSQYFGYLPDFICNLQNLQTLHFKLTTSWGKCYNIPISFPYAISKLKHLTHVHTDRPIVLRGSSSKLDGEVIWRLQTIGFIALDKKTTYLIEKGSFPKLRTIRVQIFKGDVPTMLLCLQTLKHLIELEIHVQLDENNIGRIARNPEEVLQSLKHLTHLSILKINYLPNLVTHVTMFPPNITKLALVRIESLNDDGMKVIGSLAKLQIFILSGSFYGSRASGSCFDFNFAQDGFPQLQEFQMADFPIRNWKLANGSMSRLQILTVDNCPVLDSLPSELWSLTTLRKVCVRKPSDAMAAMLQNLEVNNECELIVE
ncbi:putative disease resistance RPP13-like protein 3 isoform X3 [Trifolium pratense]|uniref:putative disease resistance RPP13-like protein 3 isoform X1 n=1 Tax=Trifolium pratense TaxID=57577 RepID=UPI001E694C44|nr:putative disease resistance RPP13-like protein 3 isoform X1 [Trifolium pratense]XP_045788302.1 putative disease resistance RPP13-like protein 3 isoform X3 [Trifolium pratense]